MDWENNGEAAKNVPVEVVKGSVASTTIRIPGRALQFRMQLRSSKHTGSASTSAGVHIIPTDNSDVFSSAQSPLHLEFLLSRLFFPSLIRYLIISVDLTRCICPPRAQLRSNYWSN